MQHTEGMLTGVTHALLIAARFVGMLVIGLGMWLLAREQRVTVGEGLPARPGRIVLDVAVVLLGIAVAVVAILVQG